MIKVTIATKDFRFSYTINEILSKFKNIKINYVLPNETIPIETNVIITTETEKNLIKHENTLVPKSFNKHYLYSQIILLSSGKKSFEKVIVGVDPGKTIGFSVITENETILTTANLFSPIDVVKEILSVFFNIDTETFIIKIGRGGGDVQKEIIKQIEKLFPDKIRVIEVKEENTSKTTKLFSKERLSKDVKSAILISLKEK
ncbi:MAG: hypothetical protein ACTSYD_08480 [Candidatus Heimdallarchaeaceae archaeon]